MNVIVKLYNCEGLSDIHSSASDIHLGTLSESTISFLRKEQDDKTKLSFIHNDRNVRVRETWIYVKEWKKWVFHSKEPLRKFVNYERAKPLYQP